MWRLDSFVLVELWSKFEWSVNASFRVVWRAINVKSFHHHAVHDSFVLSAHGVLNLTQLYFSRTFDFIFFLFFRPFFTVSSSLSLHHEPIKCQITKEWKSFLHANKTCQPILCLSIEHDFQQMKCTVIVTLETATHWILWNDENVK